MNEQVPDQRAERILARATALFAQQGDEQAVALLVDVQSVTIASTGEVVRTEKVFLADIEDGVRGTETFYWREAILDVEDHLVPRFTEEVRARMAETLRFVAERNGVEDVGYVRARPALPEVDGDWRAALGARLGMDRRGNQGAASVPAPVPRRGRAGVRQYGGAARLPGAEAPPGQVPGGRHDLDRAVARRPLASG